MLVASLFTGSCGSKAPSINEFDSSDIFIIGDVPFVKQEYQYCGPSALASVLGFYGEELSQHEIADKVYTEELDGSLITDMNSYVKAIGYNSSIENGDISKLKSYISNGVPVIVLVDRGLSVVTIQHYYVVYGFTTGKNYFVINDGQKSDRLISYEELDTQWEKMNRLMLVITE